MAIEEKEEAHLQSKYLDSRDKDNIDSAPHYPRTMELYSRTASSSLSCGEQKITARLASTRAKEYDSTEGEDKSSAICGAALMGDSPVGEIELASLRESDQILIETARSVYVFTVEQPEALSGRLIGGLLGNRLLEVFLVPSWAVRQGSRGLQKSLKTGEKLTFVCGAGGGLQELTTSAVKALVLRRRSTVAHPRNGRRQETLEQGTD
jgi:hypothetical protein